MLSPSPGGSPPLSPPHLRIASPGSMCGFEPLDCIGFVTEQALSLDAGHDNLLPVARSHEILLMSCKRRRIELSFEREWLLNTGG